MGFLLHACILKGKKKTQILNIQSADLAWAVRQWLPVEGPGFIAGQHNHLSG